MEALYLLEVDYKIQNLDLLSLELLSASSMNSSLKDAHKNTLRSENSHSVAKVSRWLTKRMEAEHGEGLKELKPLNMAYNSKN